MHGPEHWFGLVRAWLIVGAFVYVVWTLLDVIRDVGRDIVRTLSEYR